AGSRLDQMLEPDALLFRDAQEIGGDSILHRAEWVVPLELGVERSVAVRADAVDPHQRRRILDAGQQVEDRVVDALCMVEHGFMLPGLSIRRGDSARRTRYFHKWQLVALKCACGLRVIERSH